MASQNLVNRGMIGGEIGRFAFEIFLLGSHSNDVSHTLSRRETEGGFNVEDVEEGRRKGMHLICTKSLSPDSERLTYKWNHKDMPSKDTRAHPTALLAQVSEITTCRSIKWPSPENKSLLKLIPWSEQTRREVRFIGAYKSTTCHSSPIFALSAPLCPFIRDLNR